jgi:hypothetical protein
MFFPAPGITPLSDGTLNRALALLFFPLLLSVLLAACGGEPYRAKDPSPTPALDEPPPAEPPVVRIAPLTGQVISEEHFATISDRRPLAVMIDNIITATPQVGLDQADVVIEALVEGGITRFMAIFHSKEPAIIEPVRSARTPFLFWASEYDALYVHVGSSETDGPADAGQQIREWGIYDLDLGGEALKNSFIRDPKRPAPHNVLISAAHMHEKAVEFGFQGPASFAIWPFTGPEGLVQGTFAPGFTVRFGVMSPRFSARWDWDAGSMTYLRSQFGGPQVDPLSDARIGAANVIVQYANAYIADRNGHVLMDVVGEGRAQIFTGGNVIEGGWRKTDRRERTEFFGPDGLPIPLLAGQTWIEVVDPSGGAFLD